MSIFVPSVCRMAFVLCESACAAESCVRRVFKLKLHPAERYVLEHSQ